jgi:hypothetical protein
MSFKIKEKLFGKDISKLKDKKLIKSIGDYFGEDFSNVKFKTGSILPYIVPFRYSAIVFGETVYIRDGYKSVLKDPHVMAEELYHVIQWRRMGWARLPFIYIINHLRWGYHKNPIEKEAKSMAEKFVKFKTGVEK